MIREDPLASPTLAQLYITQGHYARAAKVIDVVLAAEPLNGHALVLRQRLAQRRRASVVLALSERGLEVRFDPAGRARGGVHLLLATWSLEGGDPVAQPMRSFPCDTADGRLELVAPRGPASACACLAAFDSAGAVRVLAVAEPLTW